MKNPLFIYNEKANKNDCEDSVTFAVSTGSYKSLCVEMDCLFSRKPLLHKKILQG